MESKQESSLSYIGSFLLIIGLLLCIGYTAIAQEIKPLARITQGGFHPISCPQGFIQNRDIWIDTVSAQTWIATGNLTWRLSPTQLGKGIKGDKGDMGASGINGTNGIDGKDGVDGVCPSCPPGSGGGANVGNVRWVTTWAELSNAITDNNIRSINLANNITQTAKVRLPQNLNTIKEINGHGFDWVIPSTVDTGLVRNYASLSEANAGIDCQLRMTNISFKGNNNVCMYIEATYGSKIEGCRFYDFRKAIVTGWCMGLIVDQCFFWENFVGIEMLYAKFVNGSNSASQPNHSGVWNSKFRNSAGDSCNIKIVAGSGIIIEGNMFGDTLATYTLNHNIFEGIRSGGMFDVFVDDNGSTVVKEVNIHGNHFEHQPSISAISVRLKDGIADISGIYSQYDCTLIRFESTGYAKCLVSKIPYLTAGTKFQNMSSAGRWMFAHMPATFLIDDATKWIGAIPTNTAIIGWQASGQSMYMKGITIK